MDGLNSDMKTKVSFCYKEVILFIIHRLQHTTCLIIQQTLNFRCLFSIIFRKN